MEHKGVWPTEEDLGWPVLPEFAAQGARNGDGLKRKFLAARWTSRRHRLQVTTKVLRPEGVGNMSRV